VRLDHLEHLQIAIIEVLAAPIAPDAHVGNVHVAVVDVEVQSVMETVAREEIVVELGPDKLSLRQNFVHAYGPTDFLHLSGERIVKLIVSAIAFEVLRVHVDEHMARKTPFIWIPDKGCEVIRPQKFQQLDSGTLAGLAAVQTAAQALDDP